MRMKFIDKIACIIAACILTAVLGISILALIVNLYCLVGPFRVTGLWGIDITPWQLVPIILLLAGAGWGLAKMLRLRMKTSLMRYGLLFIHSIGVLLGGVLLANDQVYRQLHPLSRYPWLTNLSTLLAILLYLIVFYLFLFMFRSDSIRALRRLFRMDFIQCLEEMILTSEFETATYQTARDLLVEFLKGRTELLFAKVTSNFVSELETWMRTEKHLSDEEIKLYLYCYRAVFAYAIELHNLKTRYPGSLSGVAILTRYPESPTQDPAI